MAHTPVGSGLVSGFLTHHGALSDKWENYLGVYQAETARFVEPGKPVSLLEIGIQNGGSLQIWKQHLPAGSSIVGMDIDPACASLALGEGIEILIGDASNASDMARLLGERQFDIIIDDGSHRSDHIIAAFEAGFTRVSPGGLYIIEDLHSSYFASLGGGFRDPASALEHFKRLLDGLNLDHFRDEALSGEEFRSLESVRRNVARFTFYDSVLVVEKLSEPKAAPYRRIIAGAVAAVTDPAETVARLPVAQLGRLILTDAAQGVFAPSLQRQTAMTLEERDAGRSTLDAVHRELETLRTELNVLRDELATIAEERTEARHLLTATEAELGHLETRLGESRSALAGAQAELTGILQSRAWRAARVAQAGARRLPAPMKRALLGAAALGWRIARRLRSPLPQAAPPALPMADSPAADPYTDWCDAHARRPEVLKLQQRMASALMRQPLFSLLVPLHNTPADVLEELIQSVLRQTYSRWELVCTLVDSGTDPRTALSEQVTQHAAADGRIKIVRLDRNHGISGNSNHALAAAQGDWCVLLDHDDLITPDALFEMARAVNAQPHARLIYSDKDQIDRAGRQRSAPLLKPAWSPDIMLNANYLTHLCAMPTERLREIGGWDPATDGAQDWDIFLRVIGDGDAVHHVPRVLYHWRQIETSVASGGFGAKPYAAQGQLRAIEKHLPGAGWPGAGARFDGPSIRIAWPASGPAPVTLVVVGGPASPEHRAMASQGKIDVVEAVGGDLLAAIDAAISGAPDGCIVLLDAGFLPADPEALRELVGPLGNEQIAIVGAQVLDERHAVLDFGVFIRDGVVYPAFRGEPPHYNGPAGSTGWYRNSAAVAGGAMAFRKSLWESLGGFAPWSDEARPDLAFSLAVHSRKLGRILLNPYARFSAAAPSLFERQAPEAAPWSFSAAFSTTDPFLSPHLDPWPSGAPTLRKPPPETDPVPHDYSAEARYWAQALDASAEQVAASLSDCRRASAGPLRRILWLIPGFEVPFYGGIHTILRSADHMRAQHGVRQAFCVLTPDTPAAIRSRIERAFPQLAGDAEIFTAPTDDAIPDCGMADAAICTLWTTAYALLRMRQVRRKFYFVQDWEPLFYPAGTISGLVESSYRFGFHAICNTPSLASSYRELGGTADHFLPSVDSAVFHPRGRRPRRPGEPFLLVCYARPGTPRNCFETIVQALQTLKRRHGSAIEIMTAGAGWSPERLGLGEVISSLGLLPYAETGDLYRAADAGLVAMATRHPSYLPFELMACGAAVVTNRNPHTAWLLQDGKNSLLCELTRSGITDAVERLMADPDLHARIVAGGLNTIATSHSDWSACCEAIHQIIVREVPGA